MPWDGTGAVAGGDGRRRGPGAPAAHRRRTGRVHLPAGMVAEPCRLVSDRTDWWNLYRWRDGAINPLCPMEAEFGVPTWVFGQSTYAFESARRLICAYSLKGVSRLAVLDTDTKKLEPISVPYTAIGDVHAQPGEVQFLGGSPTDAPAIVRTCIPSGRTEILRRSSTITVDPGFLYRAGSGRIPDGRRSDGACVFLSSAQPRLHGAGRRAPAVARDDSRRADLECLDCAEPAHAVLGPPAAWRSST